jgi:uncharacterized RDD family membrane protein YckC
MDEESTTGAPAGLLRRLAALTYDLLLTIALVFVATFALLPLSDGEAILITTQGVAGHLYHALLFLLTFSYFGFCWTRSGQTLGMKAWRVRIRTADGERCNWADAVVRFTIGTALALMAVAGSVLLLRHDDWPELLVGGLLAAPALANFAWVPFDSTARSLQDLASGLRVTRLAG